MKEITVIMSCYNSNKEFLKQSIESILNQSFTDFEFLIANNGETFDLYEFIKQFKDNRIKYIDNCGNIGAVNSFNNLQLMANSKYIAIQDHDDISLPDRLKIQKEVLDNEPNLQSVSTRIHIFGKMNKDDGIVMNPEQLKQELLFWQPIKQPTFMKRKEFCNNYKYNFNGLCYDFEFWSRTRKIPHKIIDTVLLKYRKSFLNSSAERSNKVRNEHCLIVRRNLKEIGIEVPIELCKMLDPFNHNKQNVKFVDIFIKNKDILLKHISEDLYNRKLKEIKNKIL